MALNHPKYGALVPSKKKYKRLGNRIVQLYVDKNGVERELDGTETDMTKGVNPEVVKQADDRKREEKHKETLKSLEALKGAIEKQTKNDKESILATLKEIKDKDFPKPIDFSKKLDEISKKVSKLSEKSYYKELEGLKTALGALKTEPVDYSANLEKIKQAVDSIKPVDLGKVVSILKEIADKKSPDFPKFPKKIETEDKKLAELLDSLTSKHGRLKVEVDQVGGGGGGSTPQVVIDYLSSLASSVSNNHLQVDVLSGGGTEPNYAVEIRTSGVYTYIGKAAIGSATSSAVWQVKRLDSTSGLTKLWANGDDSFNNVYDNYASLSYS